MLKNCLFSVAYYKVYGCNGSDVEEYLGTLESLSDVLELCGVNSVTFTVFSVYAKITDEFGSDVFLGCIGSNVLKF